MEQPKSLCLGRYKVRSVLGRSEFSTVYDCYDTETDDRVAVKVLSLRVPDPRVVKEMYQREVGALEGFAHPAVVRLLRYKADEEEGQLFIVLDLITGGLTLEKLIADTSAPRRPLRWRFEQLLGLLDGLNKAHQRNIIHRDVKLSNVLYDREQDRLKLVDFSIARLLENYSRPGAGLTLRNFYTPPYAAPEQVRMGDTSFPADLYAFGVVAASLLAGRIPTPDFDQRQLADFLAPFIQEVSETEVGGALQAMLSRLLEQDPLQRPKLPEVELALRTALEAAGEKTAVPVRLTRTARDRALEFKLRSDEVICADLSAGLRFRYEAQRDPQTGQESFLIRCLGKSIQALLRPDRAEPDTLIMVDLYARPPANHAQDRERAEPAPFLLVPGHGEAKAFIEYAYEHFLKQQQVGEVRKEKEDLLAIARFILDKQRERMSSLQVHYELESLEDDAQGGQTGPGGAPLGQRSNERQLTEVKGPLLKLRLLGVSTGELEQNAQVDEEDETEFEEALTDTWAEQLTPDSVFLLNKLQFGAAYSYDHASRTLTLSVTRRIRLPLRGVVTCTDVAMETALRRQEEAIGSFLDDMAVNPRLGHLLLHPEDNAVDPADPKELLQQLTPQSEVQSLVERALAARDFFFIQGPPGTGKTTIITELMAQILRADDSARILLTSQSNEAVNNAVDALRDLGGNLKAEWRIVRDASARAREKHDGIGFDYSFASWAKETRERSEQASATILSRYAPEAQGRMAAALDRWREKLPFVSDVKQDYAESVQVHGMTCVRVPTLWRLLQNVLFDWVIVDEAARANPAELMVPLILGRRFILVGDHKQLPPFMDSETVDDLKVAGVDVELAKRPLFEDLFNRAASSNKETLRTQFRMHRSIGNLVGELFYPEVGLRTGVPDEKREIALRRFDRPHRVFWIDVAGRERQNPGETSRWNQAEIDAIVKLLKKMEEELRERGVPYTVGVIAAYIKQADMLRRAVHPGSPNWKRLRIRVDTVDAFQGKQDDLIIYSLVRANTGELHFVSDRRRLNVSFSRAKRLLVIVGHRETALGSAQLAQAVALIPRDNVQSLAEVLR